MTIDEAIEKFKTLSKKGHIIFPRNPDIAEECNREYMQIAEWLEQIKSMRNLDKTNFFDGYNRAIDDFIHAIDKHCGYYAGECKNLTREEILKIAKTLKGGGSGE